MRPVPRSRACRPGARPRAPSAPSVLSTLAVLSALALGACTAAGQGYTGENLQSKQQQLVDQATLTAQQVMDPITGKPAITELRLSKGIVICPSVFKMGFLVGGSGGGCVLLARDAAGSWSAPAFYSVGSGSVGFQVGVQDEQLILFIMSQRGLNAILNTHFRLGATASASFATFGGGIEGATSTALDADIVALELNKGLYAGISLQGSFLNSDAQGDSAYYGQPVGPEDIVVAMRTNNPGDDPLRSVLTRLSAGGPPIPGGAPAPGGYRGQGPTDLTQGAAPSGSVSRRSLPPPPGGR